MDYNKDLKENIEQYDTDYLLNDVYKSHLPNTQINIDNIGYEPLNQNDIPNSKDKDKKQIETISPLKEDYTLLTLNSISHCQSCKDKFNSEENTPFLLPCNHFFCKRCIEGFSNINSINCPIDGQVAKSFNELTLLSNLLDKEEKISQGNYTYCSKHHDQKLSHFIEETKEVICVYCAFDLLQSKPQCHIREIETKCNEMIKDLDTVLQNNQQYADDLQNALDIIKKNKESVDEAITGLYDKVIAFLQEKKDEYLKQTEIYFSDNAAALSEKLDFFSGNIEIAEKMKETLRLKKNTSDFPQSLNKFMNFMREATNSLKLNLVYSELSFSAEDEKKIMKIVSNCTQLNSQTRKISFEKRLSLPLQTKNDDEHDEHDEQLIISDEQQMRTMPNEKIKKKGNDEMYLDTHSNNSIIYDKPQKQYLVPDAICRTSSNNPIHLTRQTSQVKKQYITPNNNNNRTITSSSRSNQSLYPSNNNNQMNISQEQHQYNPILSFDYRKKRDFDFDNK